MKILFAFSIVLLAFANLSQAQSRKLNAPEINPENHVYQDSRHTMNHDSVSPAKQWDHLTIISDSRIHELMEIQKERSERKGGMDGFRIQIYQGNKKRAYELKSQFMRKYPGYEIYVDFPGPEFTVRIGDFRNKSDAIKLKYKIEKDFPNPFIVDDVINFPDTKQLKQEAN